MTNTGILITGYVGINNNVTIKNCYISNWSVGVFLDTGTYITNVTNNTIYNSTLYNIFIKSGVSDYIEFNTLYDAWIDIYENPGTNNYIFNNTFNNSDFALYSMGASSDDFYDNQIYNTSTGIWLGTGCGSSNFFNNTITNTAYGINVTVGTPHILNNTIYNLTTGITITVNSGFTVEKNIIYETSSYAIYTVGNGSSFYNNNFTSNIYDIGTNYWNTSKTLGTNIIGGNYIGGNSWVGFVGLDTNGDGISTVPSFYSPIAGITDSLPLTNNRNLAPYLVNITSIGGQQNNSNITDLTPNIEFNVTDDVNTTNLNCTVWVNGITAGGTNSSILNNTLSNITLNYTLLSFTPYNFTVNCSDGYNSNVSGYWAMNTTILVSFDSASVSPTNGTSSTGISQTINFTINASGADLGNGTININGVIYLLSYSGNSTNMTYYYLLTITPGIYNWNVTINTTTGSSQTSGTYSITLIDPGGSSGGSSGGAEEETTGGEETGEETTYIPPPSEEGVITAVFLGLFSEAGVQPTYINTQIDTILAAPIYQWTDGLIQPLIGSCPIDKTNIFAYGFGIIYCEEITLYSLFLGKFVWLGWIFFVAMILMIITIIGIKRKDIFDWSLLSGIITNFIFGIIILLINSVIITYVLRGIGIETYL